MMLKLTWNRKHDEFVTRTVIGDVEAIWDLWWQLTRNYVALDGTVIGDITVTSLESNKAIDMNKIRLAELYSHATSLSKN